MKQIKTLTVGGETYQITDPEAARIDDSQIATTSTWSSKNIVQKICPAFTESGAIVTCEPVEGYPLEVVSAIEPVQEGSGDPSPENIRPICGHGAVQLTMAAAYEPDQGNTFTVQLGQTVYGGTFNWQTGELTVDKQMITFDGSEDEKWVKFGSQGVAFSAPVSGIKRENSYGSINRKMACNRLRQSSHTHCQLGILPDSFCASCDTDHIGVCVDGVTDKESLMVWLAENPLQVVYELEEAVTIQLPPQGILALSGQNTLYSNTGDTTVTGRADPVAENAVLKSRLAALEAALINS